MWNWNSYNELYHHGILGMKWGKRNGPPYPLGASDHSTAEEKAGWRKSLGGGRNERLYKKSEKKHDSDKEELKREENTTNAAINSENFKKNTKNPKEDYSYSEQDIKEVSKQLSVSEAVSKELAEFLSENKVEIATTAGLVAAGFAIWAYGKGVEAGYINHLQLGVNSNFTRRPYDLEDIIDSTLNGDLVNASGFDIVDGSAIADAIKNRGATDINFDKLTSNVRASMISWGTPCRLSCWSTSNAYYLASLTGKNFGACNFNNLVDFNDFGDFYKTLPDIFNISGEKTKDFVGRAGTRFERASRDDVASLLEGITNNFKDSTNYAADGKTVVGFINAAYNSFTCTHEFNFEVKDIGNGLKSIFIADGYSGIRERILDFDKSGAWSNINSDGAQWFVDEMHHYNKDSIRFYSPSPDTINFDVLSKYVAAGLDDSYFLHYAMDGSSFYMVDDMNRIIDDALIHVGRSKRDGAKVGSGRYPLGSGERPYQGRARSLIKRATTKSVKTKKGSEDVTPASAALKESENISRSTRNIVNRTSNNRSKANYESMSNEDLRRAIDRMRLERDYETLISDRNTIRTGKEKAIDILDTIGDIAAIGVSAATIIGIARELMDDRPKSKG